MSTLMEIETAVSALPDTEQERLLRWLQSKVKASATVVSPSDRSRQDWLRKLAALRERGRMNHAGTPLQQIMDDLRGE